RRLCFGGWRRLGLGRRASGLGLRRTWDRARFQGNEDRLEHLLRFRAARCALLRAGLLALGNRVRIAEAVGVAAIAAVGTGHRLFDHLLQLRLVFLDDESLRG